MKNISNIWHLENSKNVLERLNFTKYLKELLEIRITILKNLEYQFSTMIAEKLPFEEMQPYYQEQEEKYRSDIETEKKFILALKNKLSNYDIYFQKNMYKCCQCKEQIENCVCDTLTKGSEIPPGKAEIQANVSFPTNDVQTIALPISEPSSPIHDALPEPTPEDKKKIELDFMDIPF